jgi:DNA-binding NarL/FixJ family response regulator
MLWLFPLLQTTLDPTAKWMIAASAVIVILLTVFRPLFRKKDPLETAPSHKSLAQQRSVERQMEILVVELEKMARQITAQLDTRAAKLELLIKEADEKLAALAAAAAATRQITPANVDSRPASPAGGGGSGGAPNGAPAAQNNEPDARHVEVYALADQGRSCHEIAQMLSRPSGEIELILALRHGVL